MFNSWAYMSCLECVESMMVKIDPEILAKTSTATKPKEEELLTSRRIGGDEGSKLHKVKPV